jgi:hypothetical protein
VLARLLGYPALLIVGLVTGVCAVFVSRAYLHLLGFGIPYGIVLAIAAVVGLFGAARRFGVGGSLAATLGWAVPTIAFLVPRGEGDIVLGGDWLGIAYLLAGVGLATWTIGRSVMGRSPGIVDERASDAEPWFR